ncbi:putative spermidine/putrescine transport system permease protein [Rhizobium sp. BIGb0125]|uniref:ABC transporter permease n=1 Tax=unclassified Rhizobium TaxID=2613769 RepID=UPI0020335422|nr:MULTISPECIES: ABC transporter permease [unclassified Rhizobium]MCS4244645.1 putative spermidine/putrescine transport system permease protein [Rhizobium sp. BIGb0125]
MKRTILNIILGATLVFMAAPIIVVIINAFNVSAYNAWPPPGLTLAWFQKALANQGFITGLWRSLAVAILATLVIVMIGIPAAYAISRFRFRGREVLRSVLLAPLVVPRVVLGFGLFILFVTTRSQLFGTLPGIALAHVILVVPFVVIIFLAALEDVDPKLEEAARDLGAGPVRAFFLVTLPQMRVALLSASFFCFITSFDEVETTLFVVQPAVKTLPVALYHYLEFQQDPTIAAVSSLMIAVTFVFILLGLFLTNGQFWKKIFANS